MAGIDEFVGIEGVGMIEDEGRFSRSWYIPPAIRAVSIQSGA